MSKIKSDKYQTLTFNIEIAEHFKSADVAVVYNHVLFWLKNNKIKNTNYIDGTTWMYETAKEMSDFFGYMTERVVKECLTKLVESGFLIRDYKSSNKFDRTAWYSLPLDDKLKEFLPLDETVQCIDPNGTIRLYETVPSESTKRDNVVYTEEQQKNNIINNKDDDDENLIQFDILVQELEKRKTAVFSEKCNRAKLLKLSKDYSAKLVGQIIYRFVKDKPKVHTPMGWLTEAVKEEFELFKYNERNKK